jgi:hypothetical protein
MSLRDKLVRDLPKRKSFVRATEVAAAYAVGTTHASKVLNDLMKEGHLILRIDRNVFYYLWKLR